MTYKINPIIEKIHSPVVLRLPDETVREYESGTASSADTFDKNYQIKSFRAEGSTVIVDLIENNNPAVNWTGEEQSFF